MTAFFFSSRDKAGGYGIQALGGMLVEYVHGDFLNVVGFPLNHFCKKLVELYYPPPKHTLHHIKHDSIPSVETFENLSDEESDSSSPIQYKDAIKMDRSKPHSSGGVCSPGSSNIIKPNCMVPVENRNRVMENPDKFPSKIVELLDGFRASKVNKSDIFFLALKY